MQESWHQGWQESWRTFRGIARSLRIYYGDGERRAAMERLYGQFVRPGDLAFDIGAQPRDAFASRCGRRLRTARSM